MIPKGFTYLPTTEYGVDLLESFMGGVGRIHDEVKGGIGEHAIRIICFFFLSFLF